MKKAIKACLIAYAILSILLVFFASMMITRPEWFGEWALAFWENLTSEAGSLDGLWAEYTKNVSIMCCVQLGIGVLLGIAAAIVIKVDAVDINVNVVAETKKAERIKKQKVKKAARAVIQREIDVNKAGEQEVAQVKVANDVETFLNSLK